MILVVAGVVAFGVVLKGSVVVVVGVGVVAAICVLGIGSGDV